MEMVVCRRLFPPTAEAMGFQMGEGIMIEKHIVMFNKRYSEYNCRYYEMVEWLYNNIKSTIGYGWTIIISPERGHYIEFNDDADAMAFKLSFLELCE